MIFVLPAVLLIHMILVLVILVVPEKNRVFGHVQNRIRISAAPAA